MRRIHPRHTRTPLLVRRYDAQGWAGTFAPAQVTVLAQVQHTRHVVVDSDGVRVATVITARIPPSMDGTGPTVHDFPTGSEVDLAGELSWVLSVRPVYWHGVIAYLEVTTGERPPLFGGWLVEDAVLLRSAGRDRHGDPTPVQRVPVPVAVLRATKSDDPVDDHQQPETDAEMILPPDGPVQVASTDQVEVPSGPMAGLYQVVGDPLPVPSRTVVQLRRS